MDADRLNSPSTSAIFLDVLGHRLHISQDPNSKHLGTTVWDASMVFAKFLETNSRKGRFSPAKMKGKRVVELGAGCGLAGLGMALLGCDVTLTDQIEVLPLLMRNVERNKSWVSQANPELDTFGNVTVAELDWGNKDHINAISPPFDYIVGTDVVYAEHLLEPLLQTIVALSGPKTKIMLGYEIRSTIVHEQMMDMWKRNFVVKSIPRSKMHAKYQHATIQLFMMDMKSQASSKEAGDASELAESSLGNDDENELAEPEENEDTAPSAISSHSHTESPDDDWVMRRRESMAARLLRDVKLA